MRRGLVQLMTTETQRKMASSEKPLLHINSAPIGEEPREEYRANTVSRAVTKTYNYAGEKQTRGGRELTQKPQMLVLLEAGKGVITERRTRKCPYYQEAGKVGYLLT